MSTELPKTYDPAAVEAIAYQTWLDEHAFHADPSKPGEPYSIVIPPPNVTGALHLGHAINATLQDILIRNHRMRGFNTVWIPGIDHAGIATQAVVEKQLKEKENKTRHDVGREALVERIWTWKQQYGDRILSQLKRIGASCDWDRTRFTLDEMCARAVRETFFKLFKDGLIYRGKRLVNWDVFLQTSVSDDEIYHETVKTSLWHVRYPIVDDGPTSGPLAPVPRGEGGGEGPNVSAAKSGESPDEKASDPILRIGDSRHRPSPQPSPPSTGERGPEPEHRKAYMIVATTRPETLLGDTAVAVHSQDPRWNWAIGKFVELPLTKRRIPIIADDILVAPKFGSGVVKVTPAHDPNDYAVWQRHQGQPDAIDILNILTPEGLINENGGPYAGLRRDVARKKVVEDLTSQGLLEKEEPYETQVGHSDRSKTPIEPYLSDQWFVKMAPLAEPALEAVREGRVKFTPERYAQGYLSWLGEKRDWPISRQLWWGHRIPVWSVKINEESDWLKRFTSAGLRRPTVHGVVAAGIKGLLQDLADGSGRDLVCIDPNVVQWTTRQDRKGGLGENQPPHLRFCTLTAEADAVLQQLGQELERKKIGGKVLGRFQVVTEYITSIEQDPDVLDTWFSSALWPHSVFGWPEKTPELARYYPTSVLATSRDIITLWVARMVMTGLYNMGQVPFPDVYIHPTILDGKGERMSKTKGNGVDPVDIIDSHGADALRFTLTGMATETQDVRMPVQLVCPHCQHRFDNPEGKQPVARCPKCRKEMTRPMSNAVGTADLPLARATSDKFDQGRNFCNKLWNAARFAISNLEEAPSLAPVLGGEGGGEGANVSGGGSGVSGGKNRTVPDQIKGTVPFISANLPDRWILSRLAKAIVEIDKALAEYRFDNYAKLCYDFFWRDFCDWYVEAVKPAMKDANRAGRTAQVLAATLDGSLRLLHPMIPFITETIWWKLNDARPERGIAGKYVAAPSKRLVTAAWPVADGSLVDETAEREFALLQEVIGAVRTLRNEYKVDQKKAVTVSVLAAEANAKLIEENRELVESLGVCRLKAASATLAPPAEAARAVAAGCEVFVEGLADAEMEKQRVGKRRDELTRQIAALKGRLSNEAYISKAPAHLVEQTKEQLRGAEEELGKVALE